MAAVVASKHSIGGAARGGKAALRRRRSSGFTLIELMVSLTLGSLILLALVVVFSRNTGNQTELERTTRQLESVRFVLDIMSEDIMHAGYYGEINPEWLIPAPTISNPSPCENNPANLGWVTPNPAGATTVPAAVRGIGRDEVAACLANRLANTEAITLRHADTGPPLTTAQAVQAKNNLYIQVNRCRDPKSTLPDVLAVVPKAQADFVLQTLACDGVINAVRRFLQRTYYVASCNDCSGTGDGIPTLKRVELIDGELHTTSLAEGIESLQIEYGIDSDDDGTPDEFVAAADMGAAPRVWDNVVSARLHVLARNTQQTLGYENPRSYVLPPLYPADDPYQPKDGFKRSLMSTTVRLVNVGGRRER